MRRLRDHGQASKYHHDSEGYNGRLDAIQAAILRRKLPHLDAWNEDRRRVAAAYRQELAAIAEIRVPVEAPYAHHVYHLFVVLADRRDELQQHLSDRRIGTGLHYPIPLHLQRAYRQHGNAGGTLPVTEFAAAHALSLPMYPGLSHERIARIGDAIRGFYGR
jgi:dTDP-4-amino-4,6-dideoxygalactose transaminase